MADMLNTAVSGLLSFQRALGTTSHNIANVNTEGFSRQSVNITANTPSFFGGSYMGSGAHVESIQRSYDQFLTTEVRDVTTAHASLNKFAELSGYIDDVLADPQGGVSPVLHDLFSSIQDVADDPSSSTARFAMISTAQSFTDRFHNISNRFEQFAENTRAEIGNVVEEINSLVSTIRDFNLSIYKTSGTGPTTQQSGDLLDKRDALLTKLAEKIDISVVYSADNSMSIFIGNGQSILTGTTTNTLAVQTNTSDPALDTIVYNGPVSAFDLSAQLQGGELGGLLNFKSTILIPATNALGRTAIGVAEAVNEQMRAGMDLNGNLGQDFFSYSDARIFSATTNTGTATVTSDITDVGALTTSDYGLTYDGTNWTITSDKGTSSTLVNASPTTTLAFEGLTLTINSATAVAGDSFTIKPTVDGAESINVVLTDPRLIAAAAPIRTSSSFSNLGGVEISAGTVTDSTALLAGGAAIPAVNFTFTSATSFTSNAAVVTGGSSYAIGAAIPYTNNMQIDANGWQVSLTGVPAAADQFDVQSNVGGTGDNRNALNLANLQNQLILNGGTASFQDDYATFVGFVGSQTQAAYVSRDAQTLLLGQAISKNATLVGVNLDEEAADLIRFQQAYQAAAQVISTVQTMFDTLLQSTR
ncbi:MAG: flagellar hook-associated protein 1 FlgK [Gammaproteobacteria bacterium]|jgi:flagellar hook-associated protein 1 FlgK